MNDHPALAEVAKLIEENKRLRLALAAIEAVLEKPKFYCCEKGMQLGEALCPDCRRNWTSAL
jgi:hypothetical protein